LQPRKFATEQHIPFKGIQFVYEYYGIKKQESVNVVVRSRSSWLTAAAAFCRCASFTPFL